MSDEIVMLLVSKGEIAKARILFERYNENIFNYFVRNTFDKMMSQDLTQNVFHRMLKYKNTYREEFQFKPWIFRIARNVLMDHVKQVKKLRSDDLEEGRIKNLYEENYVDKKIDIENKILLEKALNKLKEEEKEVIVLSKYQDLKYKEIAEMMGLTESAVKVKVHRAIKKLRETFFQLENI